MGYGSLLEKRKHGMYYLRQTTHVDGRQVSRRISLRTKDTKLAKSLSLQIRARLEMIDLSNVKKLEVEFNERDELKSVKVMNSQDQRNLEALLELRELHKAAQHRRDLEVIRAREDAERKAKEIFAAGPEGQKIYTLHEKLDRELSSKKNLHELRADYLAT